MSGDLVVAWWARYVERRADVRERHGEPRDRKRLTPKVRTQLDRLLSHVVREGERGARDLVEALTVVDHVLDVIVSDVDRGRYSAKGYDRLANLETAHWLRHSERNGWCNWARYVARSPPRAAVDVWSPPYQRRDVEEIEAELAALPRLGLQTSDF